MAITYKHTFFKNTIETILTPLLALETNLKFMDYYDTKQMPFINVLISDDYTDYEQDEAEQNAMKMGKCNFFILYFKNIQYTDSQANALNVEMDKWVDYIENTLATNETNYSLDIKNPVSSTATIAKINIRNITINLIERFYADAKNSELGIKFSGIINYQRVNYL